jgi:hypothetical protein
VNAIPIKETIDNGSMNNLVIFMKLKNYCIYQGCPERPGKHPAARRTGGQEHRWCQPLRSHHRGGVWPRQDRVPAVPREH